MAVLSTLAHFLITFLALVLLAIPLYLTVSLLGGRAGILRAIAVNLLTGFLFVSLREAYPLWGWLLGFALAIWLYHEIFRLRWWKALLAFFLQFLVLVLFWLLVGLLLTAAGVATGLIVSTGVFS